MRQAIFASITATFLLSGTALADSTEGTIQAIDMTENTLILSDGKIYRLPGEFDYSVIKAGVRVLLFYDSDRSGRYVTDIESAENDRR